MIAIFGSIFTSFLAFAQMTKFKATNPNFFAYFSTVTVVSPNGQWVAFNEPEYSNVHLFKIKSGDWVYSASMTTDFLYEDYGYALALSNDVLAIGIPGYGVYGDVENYNLEDSSDEWILVSDPISCSSCDYNSEIGNSISIDENTMMIGAPSTSNDGIVVVLKRSVAGGSWSTVQELTESYSGFGTGLSVSGNYLAVSSNYYYDSFVFIYERSSLFATFVYMTSTPSTYGYSHGVSLSGTLVAYSIASEVHLYDFIADTDLYADYLTHESSSQSVVSLSMPDDGSTGVLAVGDDSQEYYDHNANHYGVVTIYEVTSTTVSYISTVYESECNANFGYSVSLPSIDQVGMDNMFFGAGIPYCDTSYYGDAGAGYTCSIFVEECNDELAKGLGGDDDYYYYDDDGLSVDLFAVIFYPLFFGAWFIACITCCCFRNARQKALANFRQSMTSFRGPHVVVAINGVPQIPLVNLNQGHNAQQFVAIQPPMRQPQQTMHPQQNIYPQQNMQPQMMYPQQQNIYPQQNMYPQAIGVVGSSVTSTAYSQQPVTATVISNMAYQVPVTNTFTTPTNLMATAPTYPMQSIPYIVGDDQPPSYSKY